MTKKTSMPIDEQQVELGTLSRGDRFLLEGKTYSVDSVGGEGVEVLEMVTAKVAATQTTKKTIEYAIARETMTPGTLVTKV